MPCSFLFLASAFESLRIAMASDRVDRYRGRDYDTDRSPSPRERRYSRTTEANPREHEYDRHRRPSHSYPDDSAHPKRLDAEYSDGHARHRRRSSSKRDHYDDDESEDDERDRKRRRSRSEHGKRDKKDRDRDREKGREKDKGPGKHRDKPRDRDPDRATPSDDEELLELEMLGVKEITEDDYLCVPPSGCESPACLLLVLVLSCVISYRTMPWLICSVRSSEFKFWLSDSRGKVSILSSDLSASSLPFVSSDFTAPNRSFI